MLPVRRRAGRELLDGDEPDATEEAQDGGLPQTARQEHFHIAFVGWVAFGAGVLWEDIWSAVASAVLGDTVPDRAIARLMHSRLSGYLTHDTADGRVVYRPVHEALADVLRDHPEHVANETADPITIVHHRIAERLSALLPSSPDVPPHP